MSDFESIKSTLINSGFKEGINFLIDEHPDGRLFILEYSNRSDSLLTFNSDGKLIRWGSNYD